MHNVPARLSNAQARRKQFHAERFSCIGGSDAVHLCAVPPWGCTRRLWYDKTGTPRDFPDGNRHHLERGTELEDLAARRFATEFGTRVAKTPFVRRPDMTYVGAHIDRRFDARGWPGVLEIKVPAFRNWSKMRALGVSQDYLLQTQWGMWATNGWERGAVWVWTPELMRGIRADVEPDGELRVAFAALARTFWPDVLVARCSDRRPEHPPEQPAYGRKDPGSVCCQTCPWRQRCQGLGATPDEVGAQEQVAVADREYVADPSLRLLAEAYLEAHREEKEAADAKREAADALKARLAGRAVDAGVARVYVSTYTRKAHQVKESVVHQLRVIPAKPLVEDYEP